MNEGERRRHRQMRSRGVSRPVEIVCSRERTRGEVRVRSWSRLNRLARAAKTLAVFLGLALVSVLIPVAHFLLVPGFLVAGLVAAFTVARQRGTVLGGEGGLPRVREARPDLPVCRRMAAD